MILGVENIWEQPFFGVVYNTYANSPVTYQITSVEFELCYVELADARYS
jgi:hypothetical protein